MELTDGGEETWTSPRLTVEGGRGGGGGAGAAGGAGGVGCAGVGCTGVGCVGVGCVGVGCVGVGSTGVGCARVGACVESGHDCCCLGVTLWEVFTGVMSRFAPLV